MLTETPLPTHLYYIFFFSSQYGTTPLIWAARKGHYESVMHLLANGADVDQEGAVSSLSVAFSISNTVMCSKNV